MPDADTDYFSRNKAWVKPGDHMYQMPLAPPEEMMFRSWVGTNKIPFDPTEANADYDMRGFWKALQVGDPMALTAVNPNDQQIHFPDYWKTPYHQSFSAESQWADPEKAPRWNEKDQLILPDGTVVFDEREYVKQAAKTKNDENKKSLEILGSK